MTNAAKKALREQYRTDRKRAPAWDKSDLAAFYAQHDDERRTKDAAALSRLFNLAAKVPALKEALDWAKEHDIEIIVDRKSFGVGGYYWSGSGVVALSASLFHLDSRLAGVAVHEIRHAWQDYHGMIPTAGYNYADYNIQIALIEADATAHQRLAEVQASAADYRDRKEKELRANPVPPGLVDPYTLGLKRMEKQLADPMQFMWEAFQGWYSGVTRRAGAYGDITMNLYGEKLGIPGVRERNFRFEFNVSAQPVTTGIDHQRPEQIRRLGKGFRAGNYLNKVGREGLPRHMLSRAVSARFFSASKLRPKPLPTVQEIRRRELRLRAHKGSPVLVTVGG